jgi:RNA polymerase sigma-70 factor (ECF subfamily)
LRPEYREVMLLRFRENMAYEDIAEITGLPLGTVKTHIHRARKEMAEILSAMGYGR